MSEPKRCSQCGAELPPDAPGGHCLNCLLQLGLGASVPAENPGDRVGRYKLLQSIGEGGYGVVYMAEQEEPVRRRVALKIIKLGMDTRQVVARFEAERQALALMEHPNIAKVFDAGATETGRPYFVMELVRGLKITEYCDQRRSTTRQRLELFIQVCQAVQHAHQKGVIHRDLKPSNILVAEQDGQPVPKIIDFGIAKATTGQPLTDKTLFTAFEQFIGTPAYMSPEQAGLGKLEIDSRSDIYSLGVLLYELLTGRPPFDAKGLQRSAIDEILRTIRETEPPRPSAKLTTLSEEELTRTAQQRRAEPTGLSRTVRGDLDWIVMKAIDKDRNRRYETTSGLANDIERFLANQSVRARPPTALYRLGKLARREKKTVQALIAATGIFFGITAVLLCIKKPAWLPTRVPSFEVFVTDKNGTPLPNVSFRFIVGGFPRGNNGFPTDPNRDDIIEGKSDRRGRIVIQHTRLPSAEWNCLYLSSRDYCGATRFPNREEIRGRKLVVMLFPRQRVTLTYSFNPTGELRLDGTNIVSGKVTLYPEENGSYRPPAQAHFSFKQNKIVGSSGVLDIGVALDQKGPLVYFGESNGRFDHCTDLGDANFESISQVDTSKLVRKRIDTPLIQGHSYIFESNIYPPELSTRFTGTNVYYAKIFIDSIEELAKAK